MRSKGAVRVRRDAGEWATILKQFQTSGQTQRAFCQARGISLTSLQKRLYRLRRESQSGFVEVMPIVRQTATEGHWQIEVQLPAGISIRLQS